MNLIAVLIDIDNEVICAYGPFPSTPAFRKWAEINLRHVEYHRYEIVGLVGVTEDKG
jgi:hypothetical protein